MSSKTLKIDLTERQELGKKVRSLRDAGVLPGVINEPNKDSTSVSVDKIVFEKVYSEAGRTQPVEINIDGKGHLAMIKEIEREPVKGLIIHFTFQVVNRNEEVVAEIPVHLDEEIEIPAKRVALEVLSITHSFEVKALPHKLPEAIVVDASALAEVGDRILVSDISLPDGVALASEEDLEKVLFIVEAPRVTSEEDLANDEPEDGEEGTSAADVPSDKGSETEDSSEESK